MIIENAVFVQSNTNVEKCPRPDKPEYAFIGRSNVGKSSLINMLVQRKGLAKTSQTPGKTQTINHFLINNQWFLVDLPGYGYARVSKTEREKFEKMIFSYLGTRKNLVCTFVLIDLRHEPLANDLEFMRQLAHGEIPFYIIFTKSDKLSATQVQKQLTKYKTIMLEDWEEMPFSVVSSAEKNIGRKEILQTIELLHKEFIYTQS